MTVLGLGNGKLSLYNNYTPICDDYDDNSGNFIIFAAKAGICRQKPKKVTHFADMSPKLTL